MQERKLTPQQEMNKVGLSLIADAFYLSHFVSTVLTYPISKMNFSPLKSFALDYQINQLRWVDKFKIAAKKYEAEYGDKVKGMLEADVSKDELETYYAIITDLKQSNHLDDIASIIKKVNSIEKEADIAAELIEWLQTLTANKNEHTAQIIDLCGQLGDKLSEVAPRLILWLKNEVELKK